MATIRVDAPGGGYDILIESGLIERVIAQPTDFGLKGRIVVTTNTTLVSLYGATLVQALPNAALVFMPDGEQYKTLETVSALYADYVGFGLDRAGTVVALGGGVVGDTAGFAAASYLRGVRLVQMPTSLLAMVDSSVGGKVGVDLPQGKNLVGAFKQPEIVLIDPQVLRTLPERQWRCGMAEVLKHGLLADEGLLDSALHTPERAEELVTRAIQVKVDVVEADPYEQNVRAHLNLGHTFAHAFERVTNYALPHGEAVGVGLMAAALLSHSLGLCSGDLPEQVDAALSTIGLPRSAEGLKPGEVYAAMATDKKWQGGHSRFVLLKGIGQPVIVEDVPGETVMDVLEMLT